MVAGALMALFWAIVALIGAVSAFLCFSMVRAK